MGQKVKAENIQNAIVEELKKYAELTEGELFEIAKGVAKEEVSELRRTSPRRSGGYANGWGYKINRKRKGFSIIVHNKKKPGLTHLLEKGHQIVQGKGGRARAFPHIAPVEKEGNIIYQERVKRRLSE